MRHIITSTCLDAEAHKTLSKILASVSPHSQFLNDLRSDTTVLVINTGYDQWYESKKFQYVVRNRPEIKVLDYEKILEGYKDWLQGNGDDDFLFLPSTNVPIFQNLTISIGRIEDEVELRKITDLIQQNGGTVTTSLSNTTFAMITDDNHLGRSGKRYAKAKEWDIPVIQTQWCLDCIKRGLLLECRFYLLGLVRGKESCDWESVIKHNRKASTLVSSTKSNKRSMEIDSDDGDDTFDNDNNDSGDILENEMKQKKYGDQKLRMKMVKKDNDSKIWELIMNDVKINKVSDQDDDEVKWVDQEIQEKENLEDTDRELERQSKLKNSFFSIGNKTSMRGELFKGLRFKLVGYSTTERKILTKVIEQYKGSISAMAGPFDYTVMNFQETAEELEDANTITELAIERSMYYNEQRLDPYDKWNRPITKINLKQIISPTSLSSPVKVSITNFKAIELTHLIKILNKFSEIQFSETFNKSVDLLIVNDTDNKTPDQYNSDKIKAARAWGTKLVSLTQLWLAIH